MIRVARDYGQRKFLSSHVPSEAQQAADEVAILRDGRIATVSTLKRLRATAIRHVRVVIADTVRDKLGALLAAVPDRAWPMLKSLTRTTPDTWQPRPARLATGLGLRSGTAWRSGPR